MKVAELREILAGLDSEAPVVVFYNPEDAGDTQAMASDLAVGNTHIETVEKDDSYNDVVLTIGKGGDNG
jgi:hypothetical protein